MLVIALPVLLVSLLLALTAPTSAQDATGTPVPSSTVSASDAESGTENISDQAATQSVVEAGQTEIAATQIILDATATAVQHATQTRNAQIAETATTGFVATQTQDAQVAATATQGFLGTQTAIAPRPTNVFQPITVLIIEPRSTATSYAPDGEVKVTLRVSNIGESPEDRPLTVVATYDTKTFKGQSEGSVAGGGTIDGNTVTWQIVNPLATGEANAREFSFRITVRSDLTENTRGTIRAAVSNQGGVVLAQTEPLRITVEVPQEARVAASSSVPQGEGLFQDSNSFALLIGLFFGFGALMVFGLSALVIYRSEDDEAKEQTFNNTAEIALLLIVLFSVIIMGVQNAIDRESINAIIGGIVGYVAGRVRTRVPSGLMRARAPQAEPSPPPEPRPAAPEPEPDQAAPSATPPAPTTGTLPPPTPPTARSTRDETPDTSDANDDDRNL